MANVLPDGPSAQKSRPDMPGKWRYVALAAFVLVALSPVVVIPLAANARLSDEKVFLLPEARTNRPEWDAAVQRGYENLAQGDLNSSLRALEDADAMLFFEAQNFTLQPQIAYLQFKLGRISDARETANIAAAAMQLVRGQAKCVEPGDGLADGFTIPLTPREQQKVTSRMCDVFFEPGGADDYSQYERKLEVIQHLLRSAKT